LDSLVCDGISQNDFEVDEENTVGDVLQQAESYLPLREE
jgi:hypothetical protein